jgi:hypothetical protein
MNAGNLLFQLGENPVGVALTNRINKDKLEQILQYHPSRDVEQKGAIT